jgi:phage gp36-like protein
MDILTLDDFYQVILQEHLEEIIEGDTSLLDNAELAAIGEATGHLNVRYDAAQCMNRSLAVDYNGIDTLMQKMVDIALFHLHARVTPNNIPDLREKRYNNAIEWLDKVASGFIAPLLPIKTTEPSTPLRYGNSSPTENRYY